MKRLLVFVALVLCTGLASCQCADKPDVGPVEDEDAQAHVEPPSFADEGGLYRA
jgi:hypothetical protein